MFYVGCNMPGYLPEGDVYETDEFADAKQALIGDLLFSADNADYLCADDIDAGSECQDGCACDFDNAAQDVNLWSGEDSIQVGKCVYWINEEN